MAAPEEIEKIVSLFSKEENQKFQEFEKSLGRYKKLLKAGVTTCRGYCIMSSDKLYNCPESHRIKY